jgi:diphthamide biosynthesis enzyme Dph1/Dph2-like protein
MNFPLLFLQRMETLLRSRDKKFIRVYMSEITPAKLDAFGDVDAYALHSFPPASFPSFRCGY